MDICVEKKLEIHDVDYMMEIFGRFDSNIRIIEDKLDVMITGRGNQITVKGTDEATEKAIKVIDRLQQLCEQNENINAQNVNYFIMLESEDTHEIDDKEKNQSPMDMVCLTSRGKPIRSKTFGQKKYVQAINKNSIVFGIGPAGTGKTFLAVALAVKAFRERQVSRIILTRPAVEAGERLGFLPGDLQNKVDPYLRPLYDALYQIMGAETYLNNLEKGIIEVAPLAYMRGRTLDDSFIILDEAQNTSPEQMKMFLTRIGMGSKAVITGDVTQIDLPDKRKSGLITVQKILNDVEGISFIRLTGKDVVRHELVQKIIKAYEKFETKNTEK